MRTARKVFLIIINGPAMMRVTNPKTIDSWLWFDDISNLSAWPVSSAKEDAKTPPTVKPIAKVYIFKMILRFVLATFVPLSLTNLSLVIRGAGLQSIKTLERVEYLTARDCS